ncbi:PAS domain-containing sensor histidine kinase [Pedobacter sp. SYSU D00535]|uniref:sensor histidine kinase n=1 Tax=Pedobacter sp. SYSU D00535 TaxID=2810308 RepID=UPI001A959AB6|nr:ATP-binding protein [Pedobacter sp. SYSU D00535]
MLAPQERKIVLKLAALSATFILAAWFFIWEHPVLSAAMVVLILYQLWDIFRFQKRIFREIEQFREAVRFRDISRHFDVKNAPAELAPLRESFNLISEFFKEATREKETQYQYLQHILSIISTGLLSFNRQTGEVIWMNEALRDMLNLPHMKNIAALQKRNVLIFDAVENLEIGESKLLNLPARSQSKILISATAFQVGHEQYKLLSFQNISEAIEETEADAWSRLLRVMTHEIMNSIAPISSLANTLSTLVDESVQNREHQPSYVEDLRTGINTIGKRSQALFKFADTYRNLSKISTLNLERVYVRDLFESQSNLMSPTLAEKGIELEIILKDPSISLDVDRNLLEQVLINLLVNAIEAVKGTELPKIMLTAERDGQRRCVVHVIDNGCGIPSELLDQIFVPFFSTKKNGSGVGLNLCRQIMALHKGSVNVKTIEGAGTDFTLSF